MITNKELRQNFEERFGNSPLLAQAPGRINIIGEHTDYNDGFVLPAAIDHVAKFAIQKNGSKTCKVVALDLDETAEFNITEQLKPSDNDWLNYVIGVCDGFKNKGIVLSGFDMIFTSDVPVGAGMSSSAAIECGLGVGLNRLFEGGLDREAIALIGQRAEHQFVGVKCGIMDQFASVFGKENHVLKIDCRTQEREYYPAEFGDYQIVLIDSKVKHELVSSAYNIRREQCEAGVKAMRKSNPSILALRDARIEDLDKVAKQLTPKVYDRCKYVIEENDRVIKACDALAKGDIQELGSLMFKTHEGLSKLYQVSCDELDLLVDLAAKEDTVIGSRMMGGGFGGCTINLIKKEGVNAVIARITEAYIKDTGIEPLVYKLKIARGAELLN